ncbi:ACT domain-containing protein [Labrys neptuniae]
MAQSVVRDRRAMIAGMSPELKDGSFVFCSTVDRGLAVACAEKALGMFLEQEGHSFILATKEAQALGFDISMPMRQITLTVHSALDGVGLTAAVASELADSGIACNMVAAYCHDHVFVPEDAAAQALAVLRALQTRQAEGGV